MKPFGVVICVFLLGALTAGVTFEIVLLTGERVEEANIHWETDFNSSVTRARRNHTPVLVHMTAPWCGPCRMMERDTYSQEDVQAALSQFVCVRAVEDEGVRAKFGCDAYPTTVFLDSSGREVYRFSGHKDVESFLKEVDQANRALGMRSAR